MATLWELCLACQTARKNIIFVVRFPPHPSFPRKMTSRILIAGSQSIHNFIRDNIRYHSGIHKKECETKEEIANDAGKWDRPLVHSCLSRPHLPCVCRIGLVPSVPEVEEEGPEEKKVRMDSLEAVVGKHEELAKKLWQLPRQPL